EHNLTSLGGVVAAAAHELGTPLATIKLTSAELADELDDRPELKRDAELIRAQAERCHDILRGMGRTGKDDLHMRHAPLGAVLEEAAEPHSGRGIVIHYDLAAEPGAAGAQPQIRRRPEVIHGLRNLVQNAVDFARTQVWVDARWSGDRIVVRIADDGPGYPPDLIGRIGDPFLRRRRDEADRALRPEYEGMGLGLFIAKTLLERSGAEVSFANAADAGGGRSGAIVEVAWPLRALALDAAAQAAPLGQNAPIHG
ncbi:MAG: two-component sensor histidine kinase, partial [Alphaproteobacteria bacterium HGW-Alphaproteobacteria-2]